jgi:hypothetical protein
MGVRQIRQNLPPSSIKYNGHMFTALDKHDDHCPGTTSQKLVLVSTGKVARSHFKVTHLKQHYLPRQTTNSNACFLNVNLTHSIAYAPT